MQEKTGEGVHKQSNALPARTQRWPRLWLFSCSWHQNRLEFVAVAQGEIAPPAADDFPLREWGRVGTYADSLHASISSCPGCLYSAFSAICSKSYRRTGRSITRVRQTVGPEFAALVNIQQLAQPEEIVRYKKHDSVNMHEWIREMWASGLSVCHQKWDVCQAALQLRSIGILFTEDSTTGSKNSPPVPPVVKAASCYEESTTSAATSWTTKTRQTPVDSSEDLSELRARMRMAQMAAADAAAKVVTYAGDMVDFGGYGQPHSESEAEEEACSTDLGTVEEGGGSPCTPSPSSPLQATAEEFVPGRLLLDPWVQIEASGASFMQSGMETAWMQTQPSMQEATEVAWMQMHPGMEASYTGDPDWQHVNYGGGPEWHSVFYMQNITEDDQGVWYADAGGWQQQQQQQSTWHAHGHAQGLQRNTARHAAKLPSKGGQSYPRKASSTSTSTTSSDWCELGETWRRAVP